MQHLKTRQEIKEIYEKEYEYRREITRFLNFNRTFIRCNFYLKYKEVRYMFKNRAETIKYIADLFAGDFGTLLDNDKYFRKIIKSVKEELIDDKYLI